MHPLRLAMDQTMKAAIAMVAVAGTTLAVAVAAVELQRVKAHRMASFVVVMVAAAEKEMSSQLAEFAVGPACQMDFAAGRDWVQISSALAVVVRIFHLAAIATVQMM